VENLLREHSTFNIRQKEREPNSRRLMDPAAILFQIQNSRQFVAFDQSNVKDQN
jgi:hypothetical protein